MCMLKDESEGSCRECSKHSDLCDQGDVYTGYQLVSSSFLVFILPLILAVTAVFFAGSNILLQFVYCLIGFFSGVIIARILSEKNYLDADA